MNDLEARRQDAEARRLARREFVHPVVLEAGAGTGKTATLIARVLVWLLGPGWEQAEEELPAAEHDAVAARVLQGVVAITFTDKAAIEMNQRLVSGIRQIIAGDEVIGLPVEELPPRPITANRAGALLSQLDRIHIETIHAFCRRILSENALASGLHPAFELDAEGDTHMIVVQDIIAAWMTSSFGSPRPNDDAAALLRASLGPEELGDIVLQLLARGVPVQILEADPYPEDRCLAIGSDLARAIRDLLAHAGEAFAAMKGKSGDATRDLLADLADAACSLEGAGTLDEMLEAAHTIDLKGAHSRLGKWAKGDILKGQLKALEAAGRDPAALSELTRPVFDLFSNVTTWNPALLRPLLRVLAELVRDCRRELRRRGVLGFNDLLRFGRDLLLSRDEVRQRLQRSIKQLLVDEVQDTDPLQYDIVKSLAFGSTKRPGLFVVGDPKQSIYGFRQADLGAYQEFLDDIRAQDGHVCSLCVNFRSDPPILDEVERVVRSIMVEEQGVQPAFQKLLFAPHREGAAFTDETGRQSVEYWNSREREPAGDPPGSETTLKKASAQGSREIEALAVAEEIQELHDRGGRSWSDFAILMRATTQQEVYLSALRARGIPYLVEKDKQFYRRREVMDVTSALLTVLDPLDQVSALGWLRSPVVGIPDSAILPLWHAGLPALIARLGPGDGKAMAGLDDLLSRAVADTPVAGTGAEHLPRWCLGLKRNLRALSTLRRSALQDSLDVFLTRFRELFAHEVVESARFLGAHRLANLQRFFDRALHTLSRDDLNRQEALSVMRQDVMQGLDMEEGSPGDESADAVRIMSVHKAKGLDFKQVFFVALHQQSSSRTDSTAFIDAEKRWEFKIAGAATPGFLDLTRHRERVSQAESVRLLYVAFTRAAERLVLCGAWPDDDKEAQNLEACRDTMALILHRPGCFRDWDSLARDVSFDSVARRLQADQHVAWVMPHCEQLEEGGIRQVRSRESLVLPVVDEAALKQRLAQAEALNRQPGQVAATGFVSGLAAPPPEVFRPGTASDQDHGDDGVDALSLGLAIHKVLELLPLEGDLKPFWDDIQRSPGRFPGTSSSPDLEGAFLRCLEQLKSSPFVARLRDLAPCVLARELPLMVRLQGQHVLGTCDLIYHDQEAEQYVVVDFKSDWVIGEEAARERSREYADQGRAYVAAVAGALAPQKNPPRFELWFVRTGLQVVFAPEDLCLSLDSGDG